MNPGCTWMVVVALMCTRHFWDGLGLNQSVDDKPGIPNLVAPGLQWLSPVADPPGFLPGPLDEFGGEVTTAVAQPVARRVHG